ncbi:MAG: methionyl-tRNA formyltransferase [Anaerolineae bacterium]|nr:methionyl-tRNA formyltransferase [Anaerolineae bacterium]
MVARIIFMGTPEFAVPPLTGLIRSASSKTWQVVAVVTQPDRPKGRGKQLAPPPVKIVANQAGIDVWQPASLRAEEVVADLAALEPDLIVVAAFGQILRKDVLAIPRHGSINVHASLLPRWRGASPVTAAIRAGDTETGLTIMLMDEGMDTGPIIARHAVAIAGDQTGGSLTKLLAERGAELLVEILPAWLAGQIDPQAQDDRLATTTHLLKKQDGKIDWTQPAQEIERQVRAFSPWPGTFSHGPRGQIKILTVEVADEASRPASGLSGPGTVFQHHKQILVVTGAGTIRLLAVQPAGKKVMPAEAMINGQPELLDAQLGTGNDDA